MIKGWGLVAKPKKKPQNPLTQKQISEIAKDPRPVSVIAREYGRTEGYIRMFQHRKTIPGVQGLYARQRMFSEADIVDILDDPRPTKEIAEERGVNLNTIYAIRNGKSYRDIYAKYMRGDYV